MATTRQAPSGWHTTDHGIATKCGHTYDIQQATNDLGELVERHDAYQDPDATRYDGDACDLCHACYCARMDGNLMSFAEMTAAFGGRRVRR